MPKLKAPLLGFKAHGSLANILTFQDRNKGTMVRKKPVPTDPQTLAQIYHRWLYQDYAAWWITLSPAVKRQWETNARRLKITGFNYWMQTKLSTLPDIAAGYRLDKIVGSSAIDFSKNLNHGTVFGATLVDGFIDHCLSFDGIDDYVKILDHSSLRATEAITLEAFIYYLSLTGAWQWIIGKPTAPSWVLQLRGIAPLNAPEFFVTTTAGGARASDTTPIQTNTWYHLLGAYDGENITLFKNGIQVAQTPHTGAIIQAEEPIYLGSQAGTAYKSNALIDQPINYSRALSPTDALRHSERRYPL